MKISREIRIGAFFIITLVLFIWGYNYLKGKDLFNRRSEFYAIYNDIGGLVTANPVFMKGLKIGQVQDIRFTKDGTSRIIVKMVIDSHIPIPSNSTALIFSYDLMGSKAINLIPGNSKQLANPGDTLNADIQATLQEEVNRQVQPIKKKAEDLLLSIDSVVTTIQTILNAEARADLALTFESIRLTFKNLERSSYTLDTLLQAERDRLPVIIENIESITTNLRQNNQALSAAIRNIRTVSDSLAAANLRKTFSELGEASRSINTMLQKIEKGEGTLGQLVNDSALYHNLHNASKELNELVEDIKLNPKRYVHFSIFGRSNKRQPYQPK